MNISSSESKKVIALKALNNLKESRLFNLSLGSKELFHSNFIAWLSEKYPCEVGKIFSVFLEGEKPKNYYIQPPLREKENIDLILKYDDGRELIIENKVKSIPYIDQLSKYSGKHNSNKTYLLLSLTKPNFIDRNNEVVVGDSVKWKYCSYEELADMMSDISLEDTFDKLILSDYIDFIKNLSHLESIFLVDWENDLFDFYSGKLSDDLNFRKFRIHDLFLKYKYVQIRDKLNDNLQIIADEASKFNIVNNDRWINGSVGDCFFEQGFTNSQGLVGFKFIVLKRENNRPLVLGIQLQGNSLRLIVECADSQTALNAARLLYEEKLWFNFQEIEKYQQNVEIKGKSRGADNIEFANFEKVFYYKYVNLESIKMSDLMFLMTYYYKHIVNNFEEITKVLSKLK
jgi:hypothetical protein